MKQFIIIVMAFFAVTTSTFAQSKVAHINVQQLLSDMPDMKAAQDAVKG